MLVWPRKSGSKSMGEDKRQKRGCCKSLSDEAIEHIILRLPPPALARFKCVSVQWRRRLSKPSFIDRYKSRNLSLLGFLYNKSYDRVRFQPTLNNNNKHEHEHEHEPEQSTMMIDILMATDYTDNSYCIVNSSNGLQLLYFSNFKHRNLTRDPFYVVRNFVTGGGVTGIPTFRNVTYPSKNKTIRFLVFGFYFDPYDEKPNFTIVEITSDGQLENNRMRSFKYNSLFPDDWEQKVHRVPTPPLVEGKAEASTDDEYHRLSGPSTFLNGSLHWLLEPYGIVAFRLRENKLFFWLHIPGYKEYCKNNGRFCRCISKIREGGCYSNGECSCRYLGEVRDQLVYVRVTGDFVLSMWILEDYYKNVWSHTRRIVVGNMPLSSPSLFFGRVLAFDRTDARVLYLRVKRTVFSYNIVSREANKIFEISKDYGGEDNCLGFIIPYEFPRIPLSVWHQPLTVQESRGGCSNTGGITKCKVHSTKQRDDNLNAPGSLQNSRPGISQAGINSFANLLGVDNIRPTALPFYDYCPPVFSDTNRRRLRALLDPDKLEPYKNDDGLISLYRHFGVTQVAVKYFPRRQPLDDSTGPPLRSYLDFKVPNTYPRLVSSVVLYNDLVRVEACLYGPVYECRVADQNDD